ncbi:hypothetical protein PACTADRAFT_31169 [Pachysolen tannophilus NRRL Y-2460]|uniref:Transcription factor IIIC subunit 5 HTH domain-containing protein n=1 Tax=Pachysolen tannophilus NRRL Y-2460 TaxID=669874 RepID=A0A1E4U158_PACTA|nr:hypothetical protein PACTADRAFT_31169 [Pachysolen tannophilus NRRL Y-2460]
MPKQHQKDNRKLAKTYSLDIPHYSSVEFPLNVVNNDKAVELIGGKSKINKSIVEDNIPLELRLRPDDAYQHPINSSLATNENLLVKIKLPKGELNKYNNDISKAIMNNKNNFELEPVGLVNKNFKFRGIADFQIYTKSSEFISNDLNKILSSYDFHDVVDFTDSLVTEGKNKKIDAKSNLDLPPLPVYAKVNVPFHYNYNSNKSSSTVMQENGRIKLINKKVPSKIYSIFVNIDDPTPTSPIPNLVSQLREMEKIVKDQFENPTIKNFYIKNTFNYQLIECIKFVRKLFDIKPIWIRKHLNYLIPENWRNVTKYALPHVSYSMKKGPWRQTYIKYGVDPKSNSMYLSYQTENFRVQKDSNDNNIESKSMIAYLESADDIEVNESFLSKIPDEYFFDGQISPVMMTFQIGDIRDPLIKKILQNVEPNTKVDVNNGWLDSITLGKIRTIIRYKLLQLNSNRPIDQSKLTSLIDNVKAEEVDNNESIEANNNNDDADGNVDEEEEAEEDDQQEEFTSPFKKADVDNKLDEDDILNRLSKYHAADISNIVGLLKQEDLMDINAGVSTI